jgi:hypothetical protein
MNRSPSTNLAGLSTAADVEENQTDYIWKVYAHVENNNWEAGSRDRTVFMKG